MYGAFIGDVIGSTYEFSGIKRLDFDLFPRGSLYTDDSILTAAIADALMDYFSFGGELPQLFTVALRNYGARYPQPKGGYGLRFLSWLKRDDPEPYNSCGNGSAMRVSPCALIARSLDEALALSEQSALVTHNHPEGIKGAKATAAAIYLAAHGADKTAIADHIRANYYPLGRTLDEIRPGYRFDGTCQGSVPESIQAFLESDSFESAIRNVISLGGDADTMGAITGSIAWAYYGRDGVTPDMQAIWDQAKLWIPRELIDCVTDFASFCQKRKRDPQT